MVSEMKRGKAEARSGPSEVTCMETSSGRVLVILSICTKDTTRIFEIDTSKGHLVTEPKDVPPEFDSHVEALEYLNGMSDRMKTSVSGHAVLGFTTVAGWCLILVAVRTRVSATLPGGHEVRTVTDSTWMRVPLCGFDRSRVTQTEAKNLSVLTEYAIEGAHFYCETLDVTSPFPGGAEVARTNEFVWNTWLATPFYEHGLGDYCPRLLQGLAEDRTLRDSLGVPFRFAIFNRRGRLHPGTRYLARGINASAGCGNEIECEQLLWKDCGEGRVDFSSYVWRRGSVPIWWGADIKSTVGEAEIWVRPDEEYADTARYFRRLKRQHTRSGLGNAPAFGVEGDGGDFSATCVNLLRCAPGRAELQLSEGFQRGIRAANRKVRDADIRILNFDWHANCKALGEEGVVEGMWSALQYDLKRIGYTSGALQVGPEGTRGARTLICTIKYRQLGVLRYNCADSLDRTNIATFFGAVPVLLEQCRTLGFDMVNLSRPSAGETEGDLPAGWEQRRDPGSGNVFYIDHNTKTTTWERPKEVGGGEAAAEPSTLSSKEWWVLQADVKTARNMIRPELVRSFCELFQVKGDLNAMLYTGSRAMHSGILMLMHPDTNQKQKSSKTSSTANNALLSVKRRYLNIVHDGQRQQQIEMFLGMTPDKYFPSLASASPYSYDAAAPAADSDAEFSPPPVPEEPLINLGGLEMKDATDFGGEQGALEPSSDVFAQGDMASFENPVVQQLATDAAI